MSAQAPKLVQFDYVYTDATGGTVTGSVVLDASLNENHVAAAEITRHQVEKGSDVTDHIRPLPRRVSVEGLVTNTPIGDVLAPTNGVTASFGPLAISVDGQTVQPSVLQFSGQFNRVLDVYGDLVKAASFGALFTVTTTLETVQNLAISNFSVPRNAGLGNALRFAIDFSEIRIVSTTTVAALPSQQKAIKHQGDKPTTEVDQTTQRGSLAVHAFDALRSAFGG